RALSPAPIGTTFFLTGFCGSRGAHVVDAAAPIQNLRAAASFALVAGGYTFDLGGHQARVLGIVPYAWGAVTGDVSGQTRSRSLEGLGDARFNLSVGLIGERSLTVGEFAQAPKRTIIGPSLTVMAPTGQYDSTRLI